MVKSRKRIAAGILAVMMTFSLAACGESTSSSANKSADSAASKNDTSSNAASGADSGTASGGNSDTGNSGATSNTPYDGPEEADLTQIIPKDTVTLDVYSQVANYSGEQLGWFADVMKEKFNVKLNIINNPDGTFATRSESGNLGDIVVFGGYGDFTTSVESGLLLDWDEEDLAAECAPYIVGNMQTAIEKNKQVSPDGKFHGFGHDVALAANYDVKRDVKANDYWPGLRYDLYEAIGKPEIKTLEDYIPVFEAMKKECPKSDSDKETYAVSLFSAWDGDMAMFVKSLGALYGYDEFGFGLYDCATGTYEDALKDGGMYLRCLKWYNTLFQKGLLDPDSKSNTDADVTAKMVDGATFFNQFKWMGADNYNTSAHLEAGKAMYAVPPQDAKNMVYGQSIYGNERIWAIGKNTQYPELCMAILNWFCTPDGFTTTQCGPKGVTWDYNDQGKQYLTETGLAAKKDKKTTKVGSGSYEDGEFKINNTALVVDSINPKTGEVYNKDKWSTNKETEEASDILKKWQAWSGSDTADEFLAAKGYQTVNIQTLYSPTDKGTDLSRTWDDVKPVIQDGSWKAIYAENDEEFDKIVAEMKQEAEAKGYQQCVEYQQNEAKLRKAAEEKALSAH